MVPRWSWRGLPESRATVCLPPVRLPFPSWRVALIIVHPDSWVWAWVRPIHHARRNCIANIIIHNSIRTAPLATFFSPSPHARPYSLIAYPAPTARRLITNTPRELSILTSSHRQHTLHLQAPTHSPSITMKSFAVVLMGAAVAVAQIPANTPACGVSRERRHLV